MKSAKITVNGVDITCYEDGSIEKPHNIKGKVKTFGSDMNIGYRETYIGGKNVLVHRLIAQAFLADWCVNLQVHHVNNDKADNTRENLRMVTNAENSRGPKRIKRGASSRFRGVSIYKRNGMWDATITVDDKRKYLGRFHTEEASAVAYDRAAEAAGYDEQALNRNNHPELALISGAY